MEYFLHFMLNLLKKYLDSVLFTGHSLAELKFPLSPKEKKKSSVEIEGSKLPSHWAIWNYIVGFWLGCSHIWQRLLKMSYLIWLNLKWQNKIMLNEKNIFIYFLFLKVSFDAVNECFSPCLLSVFFFTSIIIFVIFPMCLLPVWPNVLYWRAGKCVGFFWFCFAVVFFFFRHENNAAANPNPPFTSTSCC